MNILRLEKQPLTLRNRLKILRVFAKILISHSSDRGQSMESVCYLQFCHWNMNIEIILKRHSSVGKDEPGKSHCCWNLPREIHFPLPPLHLLKQHAGPGKAKPLGLPLAAWCSHLTDEDFKGKEAQSNVMETLEDFKFDHTHFYWWNR